jgi:MFS family permease
VGLVLVVTMFAFEALAVATAMPAVLADLGGLRLYGWAFSAFMLASLVGAAVSGPRADASGPAVPLAAGLALFAAGLAVVGAAPSMAVVVAGRAVQGLGAGAVPAVAYAAIGRAYPPALRPRMFAALSSAWVLPGLVGPALAGAVAEHLSWRLVFLGVLPLVAVAAALVLPPLARLGPAPGGADGRAPVAAALGVAVGGALLLGGLDAATTPAGALAAAVGLALGVVALRALLPPGVARAANPVAAAIANRSLLVFAFFGAEAFVPLMLTGVRHRSTTVAGLALTAATLSWTAGSWAQARLAVRWSHRRLALAGAALVPVGVAGVAAVLAPGVPVWVTAPAWAVGGLGMGLGYAQGSLVVLASAPEAGAGRATSSLTLAETLAVALATGTAGAVVAGAERLGHGLAGGILVADVVMLGVAACNLVAAARLPDRPAAGAPVAGG